MSDQDIIDTIAGAIENWAEGRWHTIIDDVGEDFIVSILAALRDDGYAVLRCECVPNTAADPNPNCPIFLEAANHDLR